MKTVIEDFTPQGGKHCITNALKQVFTYYGYPMSEEMMFGLASGLSFLYLNQANSPMVNGRTKIFEFEKRLAERLNITIECKSIKDYEKVLHNTKHMIDMEQPVLVYVDMPYLNYLGMDQNSHFGGHAVILFGYDDAIEKFWVSDRDNHDYPIRVPSGVIHEDYHLVDYKEMEQARSSAYRPFPANNKYLTFNFNGYHRIEKKELYAAIKETCDSMLYPPAQLLGINGIMKFSKEMRKWIKFDTCKLQRAGITNYFQINQDGGTGGGIFRHMYGAFLIEASTILKDERFAALGEEFIQVAKLWDNIADGMWQLSVDGDVNRLDHMSEAVIHIYHIEKQLYESLNKIVSA